MAETKMREVVKDKKINAKEIGGTGTTVYAGLISDDFVEYNANLAGDKKFAVYNEMRKSDPNIKMSLLLCKLPIRSCVWDIEPASDDPQDELVARFTKWNLFEQMLTSFNYFLNNALLCLEFGFSAAEIVWDKNIVTYEDAETRKSFEVRTFKKLASRLPWTHHRWHTDEDENLKEWEQLVFKNGQNHFFKIPSNRLLLWSLDREGNNFEGESILRSAYKPWFFKKNAEIIEAMGYERFAMGIPYFKLPKGAGEDDEKRAKTLLESVRAHEKAYVYYHDGWEFGIEQNGTWSSAEDIIKQKNYEIACSVLQQFMMMGSTETGARAVAEMVAEPYYLALKTMASFIAEIVNKDAIPKLVDANFNVKEYPRLTYSKLQSKNIQVLTKAIADLTKTNNIIPEEELENKIRDMLDLPAVAEGLREEKELKKQEMEEAKNKAIAIKGEEEPIKGKGKKLEKGKEGLEKKEVKAGECGCGSSIILAETIPWRELMPEEKCLNLAEIDKEYFAAIQNLTSSVVEVRKRQIDALVDSIIESIKNKDLANVPKIGVLHKNLIVQKAKPILSAIYDFGRKQVTDELNKQAKGESPDAMMDKREAGKRVMDLAEPSPVDRQKFQELLETEAEYIAQITSEDLRQAAIQDALAKAKYLAGADIAAYKLELKSFLGNLSFRSIETIASEAVGGLFGLGRMHEAEIRREEIARSVYSAIRDSGLCDPCKEKDGTQVDYDFPIPNPDCKGGDKCRCMIVHVYDKEQVATVK